MIETVMQFKDCEIRTREISAVALEKLYGGDWKLKISLCGSSNSFDSCYDNEQEARMAYDQITQAWHDIIGIAHLSQRTQSPASSSEPAPEPAPAEPTKPT